MIFTTTINKLLILKKPSHFTYRFLQKHKTRETEFKLRL